MRQSQQKQPELPVGISMNPYRMAVKISLGYAIVSLVWIFLSDKIVPRLSTDVETMVLINSMKGAMFVCVTALILFALVYSQLQRIHKTHSRYMQSVGELEHAHAALRESEEHLRRQYGELEAKTAQILEKDREMWVLFENMHDAFAINELLFDECGKPVDYRILSVNPAFERLTGLAGPQLVGHTARELFPGLGDDYMQACAAAATTGKTRKMNLLVAALSKYVAVSLYSPRPGLFAMVASDITDETMHARTVERLAYFDALTGLPNRIRLTEELSGALSAGDEAQGALFYFDMDDLKLVNESYGHSYGDAMIVTAAARLSEAAGPGRFVARVGGDEFVVLFPGVSDPEKVEQAADAYIESLSREYTVKEIGFHASASIGIVLYPQDGANVEALLRNADAALYEAKRAGKRRWRFFHPVMQETAYGNMQLINGLRSAIANREMEVHYQPQVSLRDGRVEAFEALLRWHSPLHGSVSPAQFIPLAEQSNLIEGIGFWTLQQAAEFSRRLAAAGHPGVRVAVNISPRQLAAAKFIEQIRHSFDGTDMKAGRLEIEITENVLIESLEDSVQKLDTLRGLGIHLSLDDFGTGYSSLTYLCSLPVQTLKIDKSFIGKISLEEERPDLIASIIDMAHALGLTVVAEGVETAEQLDRLRRCRCDTIQGFFISRAIPADQAMALLAGQPLL